ncbi:hypothetical protein [Streptomyces sp. N35]|uniref:hypothetical protein n=1 Tax=Streptomyces sp. N35 TaxID=2795730 RepID=UPI0018F579E7|nr:hypothetical protein [Streptomyces sp. N35]
MSAWHTTGLRAATAAGLALTVAVTAMGTAQADEADDAYSWGTVVETKDGVQANSWLVGVTGVGKIINARLFESASPGHPKAQGESAGGGNLVDLTVGGVGLGKVSALYTHSFTNKLPRSKSGKETIPVPGAAYANAGGGRVHIGLPYVEGLVGTPLQGLSVRVDALDVHARSLPGRPVEFQGGAASGELSMFGEKIIEIPPLWAVNLGATIPAGRNDPNAPFVLAQTNEQITTDNKGVPTKGKDGQYAYDPRATSGYVNGIHASVLGPNVADVTYAHAAVIRDPALTDKFKSQLPKVPALIDMIKDAAKQLSPKPAEKPVTTLPMPAAN